MSGKPGYSVAWHGMLLKHHAGTIRPGKTCRSNIPRVLCGPAGYVVEHVSRVLLGLAAHVVET